MSKNKCQLNRLIDCYAITYLILYKRLTVSQIVLNFPTTWFLCIWNLFFFIYAGLAMPNFITTLPLAWKKCLL